MSYRSHAAEDSHASVPSAHYRSFVADFFSTYARVNLWNEERLSNVSYPDATSSRSLVEICDIIPEPMPMPYRVIRVIAVGSTLDACSPLVGFAAVFVDLDSGRLHCLVRVAQSHTGKVVEYTRAESLNNPPKHHRIGGEVKEFVVPLPTTCNETVQIVYFPIGVLVFVQCGSSSAAGVWYADLLHGMSCTSPVHSHARGARTDEGGTTPALPLHCVASERIISSCRASTHALSGSWLLSCMDNTCLFGVAFDRQRGGGSQHTTSSIDGSMGVSSIGPFCMSVAQVPNSTHVMVSMNDCVVFPSRRMEAQWLAVHMQADAVRTKVPLRARACAAVTMWDQSNATSAIKGSALTSPQIEDRCSVLFATEDGSMGLLACSVNTNEYVISSAVQLFSTGDKSVSRIEQCSPTLVAVFTSLECVLVRVREDAAKKILIPISRYSSGTPAEMRMVQLPLPLALRGSVPFVLLSSRAGESCVEVHAFNMPHSSHWSDYFGTIASSERDAAAAAAAVQLPSPYPNSARFDDTHQHRAKLMTDKLFVESPRARMPSDAVEERATAATTGALPETSGGQRKMRHAPDIPVAPKEVPRPSTAQGDASVGKRGFLVQLKDKLLRRKAQEQTATSPGMSPHSGATEQDSRPPSAPRLTSSSRQHTPSTEARSIATELVVTCCDAFDRFSRTQSSEPYRLIPMDPRCPGAMVWLQASGFHHTYLVGGTRVHTAVSTIKTQKHQYIF